MDVFDLFSIPVWSLLLVIALGLLYRYLTSGFDLFTKQGIPGPKPYPLIGTGYDMFVKGLRQNIMDNVKQYGPLYGTFFSGRPIFNIADEDLLKEVLVKHFDHFTNRNTMFKTEKFGKYFLTMMEDDDWKRVRNTLTPTFTTGKLKAMVSGINDVSRKLRDNIGECAESGKSFDAKTYTGAFTMDVIARTAFGIDIDSQKDFDNVFIKNGKKFADFSFLSMKFVVVFFMPWAIPYLEKFGFSPFPSDAVHFFQTIMNNIIEERKNDKENTRQDFLQLMLNAHKLEDVDEEEVRKEVAEFGADYQTNNESTRKGLKKEEVLEQAILFFLAGYDTTANATSTLFYNLAVNPEWQEKVYQEIKDVIGDGDDDINYESLSKLKTLDNCFQETLRLFPPGFIFDRVVKKDITIKGIHFPAGALVTVPALAIHLDPAKWPEPEKFNPDRFLPEERASRNPFHHMPFGYGPRNCIGMRLAIMEALIATAQVLRKYRLVATKDTQIPLKFDKHKLSQTEKGIIIGAEKRC